MQFPNDENGAVLQSMVDAGMDLTQELEIEFAHLFPDEESALKFDGKMSDMGIDTDVYNNAELMEDYEEDEFGEIDDSVGEGFDVICLVTMVPTYDEITRVERELADVARACGGEPDGWGVMQPE